MKSFKHYLLIIAISALPFISIFATPLMIHSHDGPMHLARIPAYYKALAGGQILPRWAGDLYYGYGMPLFNFYYHLPYLIGSGFVALGIRLVPTFKLELLLSFLLSGVFMYLFAYAFFKDKKKALLSTALYQFAPFHMQNLVVRADIGEALALTLLPLVLYTIIRGFETNDTLRSVTWTGFTIALLLLAHTSIGLLFIAVSILFILFFSPNKTRGLQAIAGVGVGLLLDAFYWIPVLFERKYTYGEFFMKDLYRSQFAPLTHFFIPNLTNSPALQQGGVDVSFGLVGLLALGVALWMLAKHTLHENQTKRIVYFTLTLTLGSLFIMQPISKPLWEHLSILRAFQFPWRYLNVVIFTLSLLGAAVLIKKTTPQHIFIGFMTITILSSLVYWRPPLGFDRVNEQDFWNYPLNTTYFGEIDLVWSGSMPGKYPKASFEIISGEGKIIAPIKKQTYHTFTVAADTPVRVVDHTQYYPGWRVYADEEKIPIEFQDQNWRGMITFSLPAGTHKVIVDFGESPLRAVSEIISVGTLCTLGVFALL